MGNIFKKKLIIGFSCLTILAASLSAKEIIIPMIKTPFPVKCVTWNKDGMTFAYTEEKNIVVRSSEDLTILQSMTTNHGIIDFLEFTQSTVGEGADQLAAFTENNYLDIRILPQIEPINSIEGISNALPTAFAYSYNGNHLATASADGNVFLYMQNYMTGALIERRLNVTKSPAKSLNFSRDNKMMAIGCVDNVIYLVDVHSGNLIKSYPYKSSLNVPVKFTVDSRNIVYAKNNDTISILDIKTNKEKKIRFQHDIISCDVSNDGNSLIILGDDNQIYFYNIKSGKLEHYIPSFNPSPITCYSFNNINSKIAVGYKDGSVYILTKEDVILRPNEKPDTLKYTIPNDPNFFKKQAEEKIETPKPEPKTEKKVEQPKKEEKKTNKFVDLLKKPAPQFQTGHAIFFEAGMSFPPEPYTMGLDFITGYQNFDLIKPFYFGGMIAPYIAIPSAEFPYTYKLDGNIIASPYMTGFKNYGNIGFSFYPFNFNQDIYVYTELDMGFSAYSIWNGLFGAKYISSLPHFGFYSAAKVGGGWRYFQLAFTANYDSVLGYSIEISTGGRIFLNIPEITKSAKSTNSSKSTPKGSKSQNTKK